MHHPLVSLVATLATASFFVGAAQAQPVAYAIDPTHTFVTFEIAHFGTSTNRGRFDKKEGTVMFDRAGKTGKVDLTIDSTSMSTGTAALDKRLQSADFFDVAQFPTMKFTSDKMVFNGDKVTEVVGTLTLLGKTNPVTLKATQFNCYQHQMLKREVCGGDFEATILRSQWGMTFGTNFGWTDTVKLVVQAEAIKQ